jgi:DNA-binding beta-propeller fold protein YncE
MGNLSARCAAACAIALLALACGARTAPEGPSTRRDGGLPLPRDAGRRDAGPRDAGDDVDAAICGGSCDDGRFCNGRERCDPRTASCASGEPPSCDDGDECTMDGCDRGRDACVHERVERDEDRDGVGACEGDCQDRDPRVSPRLPEICDDVDNDCDRRVDEGVRSACGDCRPGCNRVAVPGREGWGLDTRESAGVEVGPDGSLRLSTSRTETYFAWIANYLFGTITKIDTRDGSQSAEYDAVLLDGTNGGRPPGEQCLTEEAGGNCPSRTAVDLRGAVYVANRAFFNQGTVTKIAGLESDCIDRNLNGTIDTSRDVDGDGIIERGVMGEFLGQSDECVLWTVNVGAPGAVPRAIALDAAGTVWVGLHETGEVVQLDPDDGSVLRTVLLPRSFLGRFRPYGAAADSLGNLWLVEAGTGRILSVNTATGVPGSPFTAATRAGDCSGSYGIAVDDEDRVWIAGFQCTSIFRFDPRTSRWFEVPLPRSGVSRGIAADASGRIYVASSHESLRVGPAGPVLGDPISRLTVVNGDDGAIVRIVGTADRPLDGLGATGVGIDSAGAIWLVNQISSTATRIDSATWTAREYPTGESPYTYSDFTGFALRTFTAPNGYVRAVVEGCAIGPTEWERIDWNASAAPGTRLEVRARTASSTAELRTATWVGPFTERPTALDARPGPLDGRRYLELELSLFGDGGEGSPTIRDVTVQYHCLI